MRQFLKNNDISIGLSNKTFVLKLPTHLNLIHQQNSHFEYGVFLQEITNFVEY